MESLSGISSQVAADGLASQLSASLPGCNEGPARLPLKVSHPQQDGTGHEAHFTVARWGHDNSTTADNPRNYAGGDEYWDF